MLNQDLHIHTIYSTNDSAIVPEQTIDLVAAVRHASVVGISDHFENLLDGGFERYAGEIQKMGLKLGVEVDGHTWASEATAYPVDYYIVHCRDRDADYRGLERLLDTSRPVIVAHPTVFTTDLDRVPPECLIEINNRYVWRADWRRYYGPFVNRFRFVLGSDAHQPNWLGQTIARYVAAELGVTEHLLYNKPV